MSDDIIQEEEIPIEDLDLYDEEKEIYYGEDEESQAETEKYFDRDEFRE